MRVSEANLGRRSRKIDRRSMIDRAILLVERAASAGKIFQLDDQTENLLQQHPLCCMTFAELRADIATVAVRRGGAIQFAPVTPPRRRATR